MAARSSIGITGNALARREPCAKCGYPVFLAERLNIGTKLYHRTCFRCARCNNQLSLANCYETETDGQYCCEICPDEENQTNIKQSNDSLDTLKSIGSDTKTQQFNSSDSLSQATDAKKLDKLSQVRNRSLSDEEKSRGLQQFDEDDYSADFESALEESNEKLYQDDSLLSKARSHFLSTHLLNEETDDAVVPKIVVDDTVEDAPPPPLPETKPPDIPSSSDLVQEKILVPELKSATFETVNTVDLTQNESNVPDLNVNSTNKYSIRSDQQNTASDTMLEESTNLREKNITKDTNRSSLVKSRMLIFEVGNKDNASTMSISKDKINDVSKYFSSIKTDIQNRVPLKESADSKLDISQSSDLQNLPKAEETSSTKSEEHFEESDKYEAAADQSNQISLSSENISEENNIDSTQNIKSRSEENLTISDNVELNLSVVTNIDSPQDETNPEENILTESLLENLSFNQTAISLSKSILEDSETDYPKDLNPFGDDDEEEETKLIIKPSIEDLTIISPPKKERVSTNPFGSSEDDDEEEDKPVIKQKPPRPPPPAARTDGTLKKVLKAPKIDLNPFWSEDENQTDEEIKVKPVPLPRTKNLGTPEPKPRLSGLSNNSERYDSNSSLSSMSSSVGHTPGRKKKHAPLPPTQNLGSTSLEPKQDSPSTSRQPSPKLTPRVRKNRKAPLPPSSTPFISLTAEESLNISTISNERSSIEDIDSSLHDSTNNLTSNDLEKEKITKDEKNRNRQSQNLSSPILSDSDSISASQCSSSDKSTHGKWKRKKGPAPARPVPQRRQIRPLPLAELKQELDIIELQQQGLEKQGVKLEQLIREKCEIPGSNDDTALSPDVEELVLELFELVNEKNELFRRQAELMYLRRQQRLEEEYADLEYQVRCLMERPERNKTDSDKAREEELINRLVEVVERRNEIVECLEMDRVREAEEDLSINSRLSQIALKKDETLKILSETPVKLSKKEKKKMKKEKKLKEKGKTLDVDKDIDESETGATLVKEKKKKKWF